LAQEGNGVSKDDVYFRSCDGKDCAIPDITYEKPDGSLHGLEIKTGNAKLSRSQKIVYPQIESGEAIPVGKNARKFELNVGEPLKEKYPDGAIMEIKRFPGLNE